MKKVETKVLFTFLGFLSYPIVLAMIKKVFFNGDWNNAGILFQSFLLATCYLFWIRIYTSPSKIVEILKEILELSDC